MQFSQFLLNTLPLAGLSLALPSANPLQLRQGPLSVGVPAKGVNCETDKEPIHDLTSDMISTTMAAGADILQKSSGTNKYDNGTHVYFPAPFDQATFMNPSWPTLNVPAACDLNQKVYYMPLWYPGTTQPATTGTMPSPEYPGIPVTTDIVLFTSVLQSGRVATGPVQFCAVLTNSDVLGFNQVGKALFEMMSGPALNTSPSGYRQCIANP